MSVKQAIGRGRRWGRCLSLPLLANAWICVWVWNGRWGREGGRGAPIRCLTSTKDLKLDFRCYLQTAMHGAIVYCV